MSQVIQTQVIHMQRQCSKLRKHGRIIYYAQAIVKTGPYDCEGMVIPCLIGVMITMMIIILVDDHTLPSKVVRKPTPVRNSLAQ